MLKYRILDNCIVENRYPLFWSELDSPLHIRFLRHTVQEVDLQNSILILFQVNC